MTFVPELTVVAHGIATPLEGIWKDTRRNFSLEIKGSTYTVINDAAGSIGAVALTETGEWRLDGSAITVTPTGVELHSVSFTDYGHHHQETNQEKPDGPRTGRSKA